MTLLCILEELYVEMFNCSIKNKLIEYRNTINLDEEISKLFIMNKLDDIVKIYNINKCIRLFEPQDIITLIEKNELGHRIMDIIFF